MTDIIWHKHHIIPKHAGGTDDPSNLLKCNIAMHAFLHEQRYRDYGDEYDRIAAAFLRGQITNQKAARLAHIEGAKRGHQAIKKKWQNDEWAENQKQKYYNGEANHFYGKKHKKEAIDSIRKLNAEKWKDPEYSNKVREAMKGPRPEYSKQLRESGARKGKNNGMYGKGYLVSGEKNHFYGKTHSEETLEKLRKPKSPEQAERLRTVTLNRKWYHHPIKRIRKMIYKEQIAEYEALGFVPGYKLTKGEE